MKLKIITKKKAIKRLNKGKIVFGLAEPFYMDSEWVLLGKQSVNTLNTYYTKLAKPAKGGN